MPMFGKKPHVTEEQVITALRRVKAPGRVDDIVSARMLARVEVAGSKITVTLRAPTGGDGEADRLRAAARDALLTVPGVKSAEVALVADGVGAAPSAPSPAVGGGHAQATAGAPGGGHRPLPVGGGLGGPAPGPGVAMPGMQGYAKKPPLADVKHLIAVAAGKGGVGKSTVALNLAIALSREGHRVGLLDCDVFGPSIPMMAGLTERPRVADDRMLPIEKFGLKLMSIGLLLDPDRPVVWRGPMVNGAITQFIQDVDWGALDYLVFDLPPGTGDVQLTLVQTVPLTGAILVCTPQDVALLDAVKAQKMFEGTGVSILGYVENMSFLTCPHCRGRVDLFGAGGTERRAAELGVPFLGALPIDVAVRVGGDAGQPFMLEGAPASPAVEAMRAIAAATRERVRERMATEPAPRRVEMTRR